MGCFPRSNLIDVLQRQTDAVRTCQQAGTAKGIDCKWLCKTGVIGKPARMQVDVEPVRWPRGPLKKFVDVLLVELDRKHAILKAV